MRGRKLRGNGLWESSRWILPEYKSAIRRHRVQLRGRPKPELDGQRVEEMAAALAEALESGAVIVVTTWGQYRDEVAVGIVAAVDAQSGWVKVVADDEVVWIPIDDIVDVRNPGG